MYTSIDCKSYLVKELSNRTIPWATLEKEWDKTHQYKDGRQIIREFQHAGKNVILSVRESQNGLSLDFDRSNEYLKNLVAQKFLDVTPSDFFVAVSQTRAGPLALSFLAKAHFYQHNTVDDDNESLDLCAQSLFSIFPDLSIKRSFSSFEIEGAPAGEVWRRLLAIGFLEDGSYNQALGFTTIASTDNTETDYDPMSSISEYIDQLGAEQKLEKAAAAAAAAVRAAEKAASSAPAPPPPPDPSVRRMAAPPPLRKFGDLSKSPANIEKHSSSQADEPVSRLDLTPFLGDDWPPANKNDYPKALEQLLAKKVLGAQDLNKLVQGLPFLDNAKFIEMSTLATLLQHPNNPGVVGVISAEKSRRLLLGENVEYTAEVMPVLDLNFL